MNKRLLIIFLWILLCTGYQTSIGQGAKFNDLAYPFSTKKVRLKNNTQIAYVQVGQVHKKELSPTLLFVHGLGSYLPAWKNNLATLQKNYQCIALDLPSYGKSDKSLKYKGDMSFFAETMALFIDRLKLKNVVLVGHSMGGQVALTVALKYPAKVQKLVLIAPAGIEKFTKAEGDLLKKYTRAALIKATPDANITKNLAINFAHNKMPDAAKFMATDRIQMKQYKDFGAYCYGVQQSVAGMLDDPVFDRLGEIKQATLLIFGKQDLLIPNRLLHKTLTTLKVAKTAQKQLGNSQLLMIDEAGHFVMFEQATKVNEAVKKFVGF